MADVWNALNFLHRRLVETETRCDTLQKVIFELEEVVNDLTHRSKADKNDCHPIEERRYEKYYYRRLNRPTSKTRVDARRPAEQRRHNALLARLAEPTEKMVFAAARDFALTGRMRAALHAGFAAADEDTTVEKLND